MCKSALADGMTLLKIHEHTEECIAAAREVAADTPLLLDVSWDWTPREAEDWAQKLKPFNLFWVEEPFGPPFDYENLSPFSSQGIPIAMGESAFTVDEFRKIVQAGTVSYLQPGITKLGGVEKVLDVVALGQANGIAIYPWQPHLGPAMLAFLHMNATLARPVPVEFLYVEHWAARLYGNTVWPEAGYITVPQGPGLGCDPNPEVLEKFAVQVS